MNNKLISSLVLLLILSFIKHENTKYTIITTFLLIYIILSFYSKKYIHNIIIALFIIIILSIFNKYITLCNNRYNNLELFENKDNNNIEKKNTDPVTMDDIADLDDMIDEDFSKTTKDNSTKNNNMNSIDHETAQKETFRLINSVKLLEKTIQDLAPTLKQGKNIIDALDKMKL